VADAAAQYREMTVDAAVRVGTIRSFQQVHWTANPQWEWYPDLRAQLRDLRVDSIRNHDCYGPTEIDTGYTERGLKVIFPDPQRRRQIMEVANAANIFPDWSADPNDPRSYRFAATDTYLRGIRDIGADLFFHIGPCSGGNYNPPADFDKYVEVMRHVLMHCNLGWADGFTGAVPYWEVWNEPEGYWSGTPEQFYELYARLARALKATDPSIKIGGAATMQPMSIGPYGEGFIRYCAENRVPIDFYSWHTYHDFNYDPYMPVLLARKAQALLDAAGLSNVENILSEWNLCANPTEEAMPELKSMLNAAFVGAVLIYLQDSPLSRAYYYRGDALWMSLFSLRGEYYKPAYSFKAAGMMLDTPERIALTGADDVGFAAIAGRSRDGNRVQVLISNYEVPEKFEPSVLKLVEKLRAVEREYDQNFLPVDLGIKMPPPRPRGTYTRNRGYDLRIDNLPWNDAPFTVRRYRLDETCDFKVVEETSHRGGTLRLQAALVPPSLELIVLERA